MAEAVQDDARPGPRPTPKSLPDVNEAIGALWERFKNVAFDRLETVEAAVVAQLEGRLDEPQKRRAEREAHKLAGSVGTFGFAEGSRLAREIEILLQGPLGESETLRLSDLSVGLRRVLERSRGARAEPLPATTPPPQPSRPPRDLRPLLLILDANAEYAARIGAEAEARRLRHRIAVDAEEARAVLAADPPDVVVLDLQLGGGPDRGLALLAEVMRLAPRARTIVTSATSSFDERLEVARRGGRAFLQRPAPAARIVEAAAEMLGTTDGAVRRVLVVDDDAVILGAVVEQLRGPRLDVVTLDDPLRFWETLERIRPDVLLLDENMPALSGSELCAVLRGDPRWAGLPVLFITAAADVATVQRVFAAGADDFVTKPFAGPELRVRIEGRLERQRLQRVVAEQDPLTGLSNRRHAAGGLEQIIAAAARQRQPASLALVDIDGLRDLALLHGEAAGNAVLRRVARLLCDAARPDEVVGRWSGDTFVFGFIGTDREDALRRLREVADQLRAEGVHTDHGARIDASFGAGVATHPTDGHDLAALVKAADAALNGAKREGRGMVLPAGWTEGGDREPQSVDIVLIEDDAALAGLLSHTMESRGHTTRVIEDGAEAVEALCGARPRLRARVIILDVDLPGRDGFDVLRSLARDGVTEHSRVVMLTVRATEPEVVRALEMGAFDHIGKPFSVQILMQRLRRALGGLMGGAGLVSTLVLALGGALAGALVMLFGHGLWMRAFDRWSAPRLARARNVLYGADLDAERAGAVLRTLPARLRVRLLSELAAGRIQPSAEFMAGVAREAGVLRRAERMAHSRLWWSRLRGARHLTLFGGDEILVLSLLRDPHPAVRGQAAELAANHATPAVINALLEGLADSAAMCRLAVQDALLRLGPQAVPALANHLDAGTSPARAAALAVAVGLADPLFTRPAIRLSEDADAKVRVRAVEVLGAIGNLDGAEAVVRRLEDAAAPVRAAAAAALGRMHHWPAAPAIAELLRDRSWDVRRAAGVALRDLGSPGLLMLRRIQRDGNVFAADMARQILDLPAAVGAQS